MARSSISGPTAFSSVAQGLRAILRIRTVSASGILAAVRDGFPFTVFESVSKHLDLSPERMSAVLGIPARTVARRKSTRSFTPQESDRLYRLARTFAQAVETLGSIERARGWLKSPDGALGGDVPLELLDTDIGSRQVEDVLLRLDYGNFS